ncbi:TPA: phage head-binding domain-containing protein [Morganella morganii]
MSEQIIPNVVVSMPSQLFTLARKFQAASNGKIFIGKIDTDPTIPENQIQVYLQNEDGTTVPVSQPLIINQAGYPVYNGQIAKFVTVQGHSMAVYDSYGSQQFYYPNVLKYDPDQLKDKIGIIVKVFNNTHEMISSESLIPGQAARTLGYYSAHDGGGCLYLISDIDDGREDGVTAFKLSNNKLAIPVINGAFTARQGGVFGGMPEPQSSRLSAIFNRYDNVILPGGVVNVGNVEGSEPVFLFSDRKSIKISSESETKIIYTCGTIKGRVFEIRNPNNVKISGIHFNQTDFDIAGTIGGGDHKVGAYGIYMYSDEYTEENPCGNIIIDADATNTLGAVNIGASQMDRTGNIRAIRGVTITGNYNTCYYGVSSIYGATDLSVRINTTDVRRAFVSYGQRSALIRVNNYNHPGFIGSNAFIHLASEGRQYDGDVHNIDIDVFMSGVEAHEGVVSLYHQNTPEHGGIYGVTAKVVTNNLTTEGKNTALDKMNLLRLLHEKNGEIVKDTSRIFDGITADITINGELSGYTVQALTRPSKKSTLCVTGNAVSNTGINTMHYFDYQARFISPWNNLRVVGTGVTGACDYLINKCNYEFSNNRITMNFDISWTGHSGTGGMRIIDLPYSASLENIMVADIFNGNMATKFIGKLDSNNVIGVYENASPSTRATIVPVGRLIGTVSYSV